MKTLYDFYYSPKHDAHMKSWRRFTGDEYQETYINGIQYTEMIETGKIPVANFDDLVKVCTSDMDGITVGTPKFKPQTFEILFFSDVERWLANPIGWWQKLWNWIFNIQHHEEYWTTMILIVKENCPAVIGNSLMDESGHQWFVVAKSEHEIVVKSLKPHSLRKIGSTMTIISSTHPES